MKKIYLCILFFLFVAGCTPNEQTPEPLTPNEIIEDIGFTIHRYSSNQDNCDLMLYLEHENIKFYAIYHKHQLQALRFSNIEISNQPDFVYGLAAENDTLTLAFRDFLDTYNITQEDLYSYLDNLAYPRDVNIISTLFMQLGVQIEQNTNNITIQYQDCFFYIKLYDDNTHSLRYQNGDSLYDITRQIGNESAYYNTLFELNVSEEEWMLFIQDCIDYYINK